MRSFHFLKREFWPGREGCDIRRDYKEHGLQEGLPQDADGSGFSKKDQRTLLEGEDITKYRSVVGRLMYLAGERPDAQFSIQILARGMAKPTHSASVGKNVACVPVLARHRGH